MFQLDPPPISSEQQRNVDRLLANGGSRNYVLGRNAYSSSVAQLADISGFIDDYTSETTFQGKPVVRVEEVPADAIVVSCVVDCKPLTALARLRAAGITRVVDYFTLCRMIPMLIRPAPYLEGAGADVERNLDRYHCLYEGLADEESRQTLTKVVNFRCTGDLAYMEGFSLRLDAQYFEDFIPYGDSEVFVDGGSFDGATALAFRDHCPNYEAIFVFEPASESMAIVRKKLSGLHQVHFVQKGLFDCQTRLRFDASAGSASRLSDAGGSEIEVTTLDEAVPGRVSFLKLDVEGAECPALQGAKRHILEDHPKLAVCVYHQQSDFRRVPEIVLNLRDDYEVYLRHYTEGVLETVMFFIPRP
jgi:FkbM family methyltransferase